ncbi:addiction module antidote protein [Salinisphaera sp. T5B8]
MDEFVGQLVDSGRYGSTSEVVRCALRLFARREQANGALRAAVEAGERSGESDETLRDIADRVKHRHGIGF